jgi:hypothetical protein
MKNLETFGALRNFIQETKCFVIVSARADVRVYCKKEHYLKNSI